MVFVGTVAYCYGSALCDAEGEVILKDSYLETFNNHITEVEDGKEKCALNEEDVEEALEKVTLKALRNDRHAYRRQVRYMKYQISLLLTLQLFSQVETVK